MRGKNPSQKLMVSYRPLLMKGGREARRGEEGDEETREEGFHLDIPLQDEILGSKYPIASSSQYLGIISDTILKNIFSLTLLSPRLLLFPSSPSSLPSSILLCHTPK
jgi:hypothetical protein